MPLDPSMILTAVHIFGEVPEGIAEGTGFIITVASEHPELPHQRWGYVATAHHVIDGMDSAFVRAAKAFGGGELYDPRRVEGWVQPTAGLDLAVAPFTGLPGHNYHAMHYEHLAPTTGPLSIPGPTLGSPIYYIGLFAPARRMMARLGSVGNLNVEELAHGGPYDYVAHLVDCRSYGGFSGSPCFLHLSFPVLEEAMLPSPYHEEITTDARIGALSHLAIPCGMFTEHYDDTGQEDEEPQTGEGAVSRYGVGVMVRGQEIKEALMSEKLRKQRQEWDEALVAEERGKKKPGPKAAASVRPIKDPEGGMGRTADLLGDLLRVPKDETREG